MTHSHTAAWQFAVDLYAKSGVEPLCLQLQEWHGADVILLLWARWLTAQSAVLTPDLLALAQQRVRPWREQVLLPLRQSRKAAKLLENPTAAKNKTSKGEIYSALKSVEISVERKQLQLLTDLFDEWSNANLLTNDSAAAQNNVHNYLICIGLATIPSEWLVTLEL